jgi:transcriptional regulator with XRE-family HTH domain
MATTVTVSQKIRSALWAKRAAGEKQYHLARKADVDPSTFSALVNDIVQVKPDDPRVLRIAEVLGVPAAEAFTITPDRQATR